MANKILIIQTDLRSAQPLADYFYHQGDRTWQTTSLVEAAALLVSARPSLIILDLHLPGIEWQMFAQQVIEKHPKTKLLMTNRYPDLAREMTAKDLGAYVFLREPFGPEWIENALRKLNAEPDLLVADKKTVTLPPVRWPMRLSITGPYAILALTFAVLIGSLVSQYITDSLRSRLADQLIDLGRLTNDSLVRQENSLLASVRLMANIEGVSEAILARDMGVLQNLAVPVITNVQQDALEILDTEGVSILSLRYQPTTQRYVASQGSDFSRRSFVQRVLTRDQDGLGDKFGGISSNVNGTFFYVAGPVFNSNQELVGVVLVGQSLPTLVNNLQAETQAHITFYDQRGELLASTSALTNQPGGQRALASDLVQQLLSDQNTGLIRPDIVIDEAQHSEILNPWVARGGEQLGVLGVALRENFVSSPSFWLQVQVMLVVVVGLWLIIGLGLAISNRITQPVAEMMDAAIEVAEGHLETKVTPKGNDEVAVLGHAFNYMISGLQEGRIYHDLLGRAVSPQVREELRVSFASGHLRLEGQSVHATILMSDIRGFTTLAENEAPPTIFKWLNEYFTELVPIINAHGGVVDKFEGDAILAFFGILPTPLPARESAEQACLAALDMMRAIEHLNTRRAERGESPFTTGIGINTGLVTAGGLGTADRLNYTIIGDTVNSTQRVESFTRNLGETSALISEHTLHALEERASYFALAPLGAQLLKGKTKELFIYRLLPRSDLLVRPVLKPNPSATSLKAASIQA